MGGPLTLFWTWVIASLSQKYMIAWRKLLAATLLVWMVGVLLSPFAKTFDELITFQIVMFLGFAPLSASLVSLATNFFPSQCAKRIFLLLVIVAILGMVCGALPAALSTTSLPWVIPLVIVGVWPGVLGGFILEIRVPLNSPQEPASHLNNPNNSSWVRVRFSPRFLLINGVLNLALGVLIYYFAQIFLSPDDITASIIILFLLTIYNSHLLYCAFRMSGIQAC